MPQNDLTHFGYMLHHDPAAVLGFLFIGAAGVLLFHVQQKMTRAGHRVHYFSAKKYETPQEYLKLRRDYGWSPWPAYLILPCFALGLGLLIFGLFRL